MSFPLAGEIEKFSLSCLRVLLQVLGQLEYFLCLENGEKESLSISFHIGEMSVSNTLWSTQSL